MLERPAAAPRLGDRRFRANDASFNWKAVLGKIGFFEGLARCLKVNISPNVST